MTLIVAERTRNVRHLLTRELKKNGHTVSLAANGYELCQELERDPVRHVILLDPDLPDLMDQHLLHRLRQALSLSILIIHSYEGQPFQPLKDLTLSTFDRNDNIEVLLSYLHDLMLRLSH